MSVLNSRDPYGESNILAFIKEVLRRVYCNLYALPVGCLCISQCSKLMVHSAPGTHIFAAGRTFFGHVRPMCGHLFTIL